MHGKSSKLGVVMPIDGQMDNQYFASCRLIEQIKEKLLYMLQIRLILMMPVREMLVIANHVSLGLQR